MIHLGKYGTPIVSARFEAWEYGPVNRTLYDETKRYGTEPLSSSNIPGNHQAVIAKTHKEEPLSKPPNLAIFREILRI